jgi:hypothetical protein
VMDFIIKGEFIKVSFEEIPLNQLFLDEWGHQYYTSYWIEKEHVALIILMYIYIFKKITNFQFKK